MRRLVRNISWPTLGQVVGVYLAGSWFVLQIVDVLSNNLEMPGWLFRVVLLLLLIGLPVATVAGMASRSRPSGKRGALKTAGALLLGASVIGGLLMAIPGVRQTGRKALLGADLPGVAILPFRYVGPKQEESYIADAVSIKLSEAVRQTGVFTPSWSAVELLYRDLPSMAEVGRRLRVPYVLTGNLVSNGDQLELSVWLTRVSDDAPVWQRTFDGVSQDLSDFEFEIVRAVIDSLATFVGIEPATVVVKRYTESSQADSLYTRGIYLINQFYDADTALVARSLFERAIAEDGEFAPAYVALAATISAQSRVFWSVPPNEAGPQVRDLLLKVQSLAPELTSVWKQLGWYEYVFGRNWSGATRYLDKAMEQSPKDAESRSMAAFVQVITGNPDSALALAGSASSLEPHNPLIVSTECWLLYLTEQYSEGIDRCRFVLDSIQPGHGAAVAIGETLEFTRRFLQQEAPTPARDSAARTVLDSWKPPATSAEVSGEMSPALRLAQLGWTEDARRLLAEDMKFPGIRPLRVANVFAALGDMDVAWDWLGQAYEARDPNLAEIGVRPEMKPFREDPRYLEFKRRMRLP